MTAMTGMTHMLFNIYLFCLLDNSLPMTSSLTSTVTSPAPSPVTSPPKRSKQSEPQEPEDMDIIKTSDTGG